MRMIKIKSRAAAVAVSTVDTKLALTFTSYTMSVTNQ